MKMSTMVEVKTRCIIFCIFGIKIGCVAFSDHLCFDEIYYLELVSQPNISIYFICFSILTRKVNYCGSKNKVYDLFHILVLKLKVE